MADSDIARTDLRFFTNDEPGTSLYERFQKTLAEVRFFDVLVGYFRVSGFCNCGIPISFPTSNRHTKPIRLISNATAREGLLQRTRSLVNDLEKTGTHLQIQQGLPQHSSPHTQH